jgi:NAD(P)-dependent dehydrogenase (short-subunit alcohol dehydrogenase family)
LRRYGEHLELANLASYLVSDQAAYITGECVVIDGGKRYLGGAGTSSAAMLDWSDAEWLAVREKTRGDKA